jgi:precorrin-6A/cobalt-precorrin-6A reductase
MDRPQMLALMAAEGIRAVVDVSHPYAAQLHATAAAAAQEAGVPYLRLARPATSAAGACVVPDHETAARIAFGHGLTVLLTTGSRNLAPYVEASRRTGVAVFARVLDHPESLAACAAAGLQSNRIILGRGPFSLAANRALIRQHGIGVMVTKDSGRAGGVDEKIAAAQQENCEVIVVGRPEGAQAGHTSMPALLDELFVLCPGTGHDAAAPAISSPNQLP